MATTLQNSMELSQWCTCSKRFCLLCYYWVMDVFFPNIWYWNKKI